MSDPYDGSGSEPSASGQSYPDAPFDSGRLQRILQLQTRGADPSTQEQIQRLFREYSPPLHMRLGGFTRDGVLARAERVTTAFSQGLGRTCTDAEARALGERTISDLSGHMSYSWSVGLMSVWATYFEHFCDLRLHNTEKLPSLSKHLKPHHITRFLKYFLCSWCLGRPFFIGYVAWRWSSTMKSDPRLADIAREISRPRLDSPPGRAAAPQTAKPNTVRERPWPSQLPADDTAQQTSTHAQTQDAWTALRQKMQSQAEAPPEPKAPWDSFLDGIDNASPIDTSAPETRGDSQDGGSAWDRIRQQASSQTSQNPQRPQHDGADPQNRDCSDSYTFSSSDEEKTWAKAQAQEEFDAMLERERRGRGD